MKKVVALIAVLTLLGCGAQKVTKAPTKQAEPSYIEKINEALKTAKEYHLAQAIPDLWEGLKIYTESAKRLCLKQPKKCPQLYQSIRKAVLSGIKIAHLMENAP